MAEDSQTRSSTNQPGQIGQAERLRQADASDLVFRALADDSRRRLLDRLNAHNGQNLRELCAGLGMARQSVSKHLGILEAANLVTTVRRGREKLHYLNPVPINDIAERWIKQYDRERVRALSDLKRALEDSPMEPAHATPSGAAGAPAFVYTIYISTTPEKLWKALTDPAFTKRYWGLAFETDWQVGSPMTWQAAGVTITDPEQMVLEYDPYRRLAYTWQTITPEFATAAGFSDDYVARAASEPRSLVRFELEPQGQVVKLTVSHEGFAPGSVVLKSIGRGWPQVLSSLKTFLETGAAIDLGTDELRRERRVVARDVGAEGQA
ncbi:MAG TPA: metalloregulator ArsR/SmtB family transcription factor [Ktedonobacterales bacterium]|jgi:uncharacterized protein YndB with AHSA1/START domain/DNA-binding transcriptional ArsR family regulator|nr:metalloregulator ArsR/SmtB family transcription factor [Ktedonobacterales bacterium]